jgi:hypothetical protein
VSASFCNIASIRSFDNSKELKRSGSTPDVLGLRDQALEGKGRNNFGRNGYVPKVKIGVPALLETLLKTELLEPA